MWKREKIGVARFGCQAKAGPRRILSLKRLIELSFPGSFYWGSSSVVRGVGRLCWLIVTGALFFGPATSADSANRADNSRRFILNEDMIEGLQIPDSDACKFGDVLRDLFRQIGDVAYVRPSENFYYFSFFRNGKAYSGSLRLARDDRDQGFVRYVCYETYTNWLQPYRTQGTDRTLSAADGVTVKKVGELEYEVGFEGATVKFVLNKLDQSPDATKLRSEEKFAGRSADESGLLFDLVYNPGVKAFYFVLDRRQAPLELARIKPRIVLDRRTGFIFFEDSAPERLVLVAVHSGEVTRNTWFDGPFDQLPENFYDQVGFWNYVFEASPELKGQLTPGGTKIGTDLVYSIFAYRQYASSSELSFVDRCARKFPAGTKLVLCLTGQDGKRRRH